VLGDARTVEHGNDEGRMSHGGLHAEIDTMRASSLG
jgi:hypothetical protein